jgi:hypothetical protein
MQNFNSLKNNFFQNKKCNKTLNSLYEVEYFLRNLSCAKNSICFAKSAKFLMKKSKKY